MQSRKVALKVAKYIEPSGRCFLFFSCSSRNILCHTIVPHPLAPGSSILPEVLSYRHDTAPRGYFLECTRLHARARRKYRGKSARWRHGESARSLASFDFALLLSSSSRLSSRPRHTRPWSIKVSMEASFLASKFEVRCGISILSLDFSRAAIRAR